MNLVEIINAHATPRLPESISTILGNPPDRVRACLEAAVPSIVAALAARAGSADDAHTLARTLASADESILADVPVAVTTQGAAIMNRGGDQLGSLVGGGALTALIGAIARYTGKSPGSVRSITGFAAAVVLATLRREQRNRGLDEAALAKLLAEQKPMIAAAMPASLPGLLAAAPGLGPIAEYMRTLVPATPTAAAPAHRPHAQTSHRHSAATAPAVSHNPGREHNGHHQHHHRHPPRARSVPAWAWTLPVVAILAVGWLIIGTLGRPAASEAGAIPAAGGASRTFTVASATPADVENEVTQIIDSAAMTLGTVRDLPTAEAALPTIRELNDRLDEARRAFDRLSESDRAPIVSIVADNLGGRLRNAFDRIQGSRPTRELLGPHVETLLRKLRGFTATE